MVSLLRERAAVGIEMRELVRLSRPLPSTSNYRTASIWWARQTISTRFSIHTGKPCTETALKTIEKFHLQHPDEPGIDVARLRRLAAPGVNNAVWRALIDELLRAHALAHSDHWLHLPQHRVSLDEREQQLAGQLQSILAAARYDPPWVRDLAARVPATEELIRRCCANAPCNGRCTKS